MGKFLKNINEIRRKNSKGILFSKWFNYRIMKVKSNADFGIEFYFWVLKKVCKSIEFDVSVGV